VKELHEKCGIGMSPGDVANRVHGCTPDEGSNMLLGWNIFEGAGCVCHRMCRCLVYCLEDFEVAPIVKKVKGICAHFHRSQKVCTLLLCYCAYCTLVVNLNNGFAWLECLCRHCGWPWWGAQKATNCI
jgi:hypothetical protein